ncbi:MAG: VCBS repeat-containing protein, partial [Acidobacteria bacterium]|nr:VCBS repeat-containing protein [Acidobacteriota bacterium]
QNDTTGAVALWRMNGATLEAGFNLGAPGAGANSKVVALGNLGGNAIVFQNTQTNAISRWIVTGTTVTSQLPISTPASGWTVAGAGDFDADNHGDLVLQNSSSRAIAIWLLDANGTAIVQGTVVGTPVPNWKVMGTADYDGDGKTDLLLWNSVNNGIAEWEMNGASLAKGVALNPPAAGWKPLGN